MREDATVARKGVTAHQTNHVATFDQPRQCVSDRIVVKALLHAFALSV